MTRAYLPALLAATFWAVASSTTAQDNTVPALDRPLRAIHNAGNWGLNRTSVDRWKADPSNPILPPTHVDWVESLNTDWVGISIALHVDDSVDSTVERRYAGVGTPTFTDDALRQIIREYRQLGIDVYVTLAFEIHEAASAERPLARYLLGDPGDAEIGKPLESELLIDSADWPWNPDHPDHERFTAEFWATYTAQAVHFARLAQAEGARMFSLGTETDNLFRTRGDDGYWRNDYLAELRAMVAGVRGVFSGLVTYDMHYTAVVHDHYAPGSRHLWSDLGLDIVGLSAWFPLADAPPATVLSVDTLRRRYDRIFRDHLIPVSTRSRRPILFLEYGIVDMVERPFEPDLHGLGGPPFSDADGNGLDDGQEQQANVIEALFQTIDDYPGVVYGAFLWNNWIASDEDWALRLADEYLARDFSIRTKLAEHFVRAAYDRLGALRWLPPFTDDPIEPGVTPVRAVHFIELRTRIDALRSVAGLPRFVWTDPVLRAGVTPVRLAHILELRSALAEVYAVSGQPAPVWSDASPTAGATAIRAEHLMELRAVVLALE